MILVTGATGNVGSAVLEQLVEAGQKVRALVRDPAKLGELGRKVEVVKGDLTRPETLDAAFAGVDKAFVLFTGADLATLASNAAEAAKKADVTHLVMLSSSTVVQAPESHLGRWHIDAEAKIKASGLAFTILQPGAFASNTLNWAGSIKSRGAVFQPTGDGKAAPIDPHDIAAVAVKVLTSPGHEGKSYMLTGPEALSTAEQVAKISAAIGKPVAFVDVTEDAARDGMVKAGLPEVFIRAILEANAMVRAGRGADITNTVEELLGRKARTFDDWLKSHGKAFQ
ncbi:SDR family oxidoreductase [Polyangium sp. y55x31]|uniref:SDR family oxidoreductase n=1 Tax=Polyangium sp. y55x31 TaxID=3042688 RepID=UPI002482631A|nr:SDR family oxidoreductase [Polyangium sp. y55x31]MDI1481341.1 SDR family oxidoreductase [Polyangium sp. y55x31]